MPRSTNSSPPSSNSWTAPRGVFPHGNSPVEISIPSFAKVNWILRVLGKRDDGFHEVATLLQTVDLRDEIELERVADGIELDVQGRPVALGEDNLVWRAARLLQQRFGIGGGLRVRLHKRIPVGAGLGGGSSNAAITLLALNRLWDLGLRRRQLAEVGAELGSDVPFFLFGGTALGQGRGERLTPFPDPPDETLLLLYPGFEISAAEAYGAGGWESLQRLKELTKRQVDTTILRFRRTVERGLSVLDLVENDFDGPLLSRYPRLVRASESLRRAGCRRVVLCGSGSTLLGWVPAHRLDEASGAVSRDGVGEVLVCRTLSRARYWDILAQANLNLED